MQKARRFSCGLFYAAGHALSVGAGALPWVNGIERVIVLRYTGFCRRKRTETDGKENCFCTFSGNDGILTGWKAKMDYLSKVMTAAIWGERPPEAPAWNQWVHKSRGITHCETCLSLHGRWFLREKTPSWPYHPYCHCELESVPYSDVLRQCRAVCLRKDRPLFFQPRENVFPYQRKIACGMGICDHGRCVDAAGV